MIWYRNVFKLYPPRPTCEGGNVSLTKCGVEYLQRHAQKTLQLSVFYAHAIGFALMILFFTDKKSRPPIQFSFELCSLQKRIPCAGFVICTSPKPAWGAKNAWFWLERTKTCIYSKKQRFDAKSAQNLHILKKNQHFDTKSAQNLHILKKIKSFYSEKSPNLHILAQKTKNKNQFVYASQSHIESEIFTFLSICRLGEFSLSKLLFFCTSKCWFFLKAAAKGSFEKSVVIKN